MLARTYSFLVAFTRRTTKSSIKVLKKSSTIIVNLTFVVVGIGILWATALVIAYYTTTNTNLILLYVDLNIHLCERVLDGMVGIFLIFFFFHQKNKFNQALKLQKLNSFYKDSSYFQWTVYFFCGFYFAHVTG